MTHRPDASREDVGPGRPRQSGGQQTSHLLTREECDRVRCQDREGIDATDDRDRTIVALLLDTAVRASELCTWTLDVVLGPRCEVLLVAGQDGPQRRVEPGPQAAGTLRQYLQGHRLLQQTPE